MKTSGSRARFGEPLRQEPNHLASRLRRSVGKSRVKPEPPPFEALFVAAAVGAVEDFLIADEDAIEQDPREVGIARRADDEGFALAGSEFEAAAQIDAEVGQAAAFEPCGRAAEQRAEGGARAMGEEGGAGVQGESGRSADGG